ncbi:phosphatase PAP2 family protein [Clostridium sp.]|uniref:phosphatase PAP2 family protein n=1 Tax=Clostridium sp. TaxID=1506 RepID=UPI003F2A09E0
MDLIYSFDIRILMWIREYLDCKALDNIMKLVSTLGNAGAIWIFIGIVLLFSKRYRGVGITLLLALLITSILGEGIIKNIIQRVRPFVSNPDIKLIIEAPNSYSFPSGHTASSFAAANVLAKYFKDKKYLFYGFAALMAFSRLYLFVHYPSDIIGGIILGLIGGRIAIYIYKKYLSRKNKSKIFTRN